MGIDILGIDIMGVDILGIDISAPTRLAFIFVSPYPHILTAYFETRQIWISILLCSSLCQDTIST